jgi:hypothetical protein
MIADDAAWPFSFAALCGAFEDVLDQGIEALEARAGGAGDGSCAARSSAAGEAPLRNPVGPQAASDRAARATARQLLGTRRVDVSIGAPRTDGNHERAGDAPGALWSCGHAGEGGFPCSAATIWLSVRRLVSRSVAGYSATRPGPSAQARAIGLERPREHGSGSRRRSCRE